MQAGLLACNIFAALPISPETVDFFTALRLPPETVDLARQKPLRYLQLRDSL